MTLKDAVVITALSQVDALFEPIRDWRADFWVATHHLRANYSRHGLGYRGSGLKESERALRSLAKSRLIARRRGANKTVAIVLLEAGFREGWRLTGVGQDQAIVVLTEAARLRPAGQWVPETAFNEGRGWGDGDHSAELKNIQRFHTPALSLRWLESQADFYGRVGYRVTPRGLEVLRKDASEGEHEELPAVEPEREAVDLYLRVYADSIHWLDAQTNILVGRRGETGPAFLPLTAWLEHEQTVESGGRQLVASPYTGS